MHATTLRQWGSGSRSIGGTLYGATLGGPIVKDRLFFFGDYQGIKALIRRTVISTVPTVAERAGNFAGVAKIYDPTRGRRWWAGVISGRSLRAM